MIRRLLPRALPTVALLGLMTLTPETLVGGQGRTNITEFDIIGSTVWVTCQNKHLASGDISDLYCQMHFVGGPYKTCSNSATVPGYDGLACNRTLLTVCDENENANFQAFSDASGSHGDWTGGPFECNGARSDAARYRTPPHGRCFKRMPRRFRTGRA